MRFSSRRTDGGGAAWQARAVPRVSATRWSSPRVAVDEQTLFPLFSNTKVVTAAAVWTLVEEGKLRFSDRIAEHIPGFEAHGKEDRMTLAQLLTHQAGFPARRKCGPDCFTDREKPATRGVQGSSWEWPPGSTRSVYHRTAAHWVIAAC